MQPTRSSLSSSSSSSLSAIHSRNFSTSVAVPAPYTERPFTRTEHETEMKDLALFHTVALSSSAAAADEEKQSEPAAPQSAEFLREAPLAQQLNALTNLLPLEAKLEFLQKIDQNSPLWNAKIRALFSGRTSEASTLLATKIKELSLNFSKSTPSSKDFTRTGYDKSAVESIRTEIIECWQALMAYMNDAENSTTARGNGPRTLFRMIQAECQHWFNPEEFKIDGPASFKPFVTTLYTSIAAPPYLLTMQLKSSLKNKSSVYQMYEVVNRLDNFKNLPAEHLKDLVNRILTEYKALKQQSSIPTKSSFSSRLFMKNLEEFIAKVDEHPEQIVDELNVVIMVNNFKLYLLMRDLHGNFANNGKRLFGVICKNINATAFPN